MALNMLALKILGRDNLMIKANVYTDVLKVTPEIMNDEKWMNMYRINKCTVRLEKLSRTQSIGKQWIDRELRSMYKLRNCKVVLQKLKRKNLLYYGYERRKNAM